MNRMSEITEIAFANQGGFEAKITYIDGVGRKITFNTRGPLGKVNRVFVQRKSNLDIQIAVFFGVWKQLSNVRVENAISNDIRYSDFYLSGPAWAPSYRIEQRYMTKEQHEIKVKEYNKLKK